MEIRIAHIAEKNSARWKIAGIPRETFCSEGRTLVQDPEVNIVVELIGGRSVSRDLVLTGHLIP